MGSETRSSRALRIVLVGDYCKGCLFCVEFCPKRVLERGTQLNNRGIFVPIIKHPERCAECRLCEELCPDFAIFIAPEPQPEKSLAMRVVAT